MSGMGMSFYFVGMPILVLLQTLLLLIGISALRRHNAIDARKTAFRQITFIATDDVFSTSMRRVSTLRHQKIDLAALLTATSRSEDDTKNLAAASYILKLFTIIAIGIENRVMDEAIFRSYYFTTVVEIVGYLQPYINESRAISRRNSTHVGAVKPEIHYEEVERLYLDWLKPKKGGYFYRLRRKWYW